MQNQNIVITGGTDGMGKALALRLAELDGSGLLLVSRNPSKGAAAVDEIQQATGNTDVSFLQADLSIVKNVCEAAKSIRKIFTDRVDVLVHCAGNIFPHQRTLTKDGLELSFAIQYMARYLLTKELLDLLRGAPSPQVLSVMGGGTIQGKVDFDNLQGEKSYGFVEVIQTTSRTGDLLSLQQMEEYPEVAIYNYGPGLVRSGLIMKNPFMRFLMNTVGRLFSRSVNQAADDMMTLLTGDHSSGLYGIGPEQNDLPESASDPATIQKVWDYGEKLVDDISAQSSTMKM